MLFGSCGWAFFSHTSWPRGNKSQKSHRQTGPEESALRKGHRDDRSGTHDLRGPHTLSSGATLLQWG